MDIWLKRRLFLIDKYIDGCLLPETLKRFYNIGNGMDDYYSYVTWDVLAWVRNHREFIPRISDGHLLSILNHIKNNHKEKIKELIKEYEP